MVEQTTPGRSTCAFAQKGENPFTARPLNGKALTNLGSWAFAGRLTDSATCVGGGAAPKAGWGGFVCADAE